MTRTDIDHPALPSGSAAGPSGARAIERLRQRQRHYEWSLARESQTTAAAQLVRGKTHDLLNLVQIVQLATGELARRCDQASQEFIHDLERAGAEAQRSLAELMEIARPAHEITAGPAVGVAITAALELVRPLIAIDVRLAVGPDTATRCSAEDLEQIIIGLALDVLGSVPRFELFVRERQIDRKPWVEIVRSSSAAPGEDNFELRVIEAIATRAAGELAVSERRDGGSDVVVALPVVARPVVA